MQTKLTFSYFNFEHKKRKDSLLQQTNKPKIKLNKAMLKNLSNKTLAIKLLQISFGINYLFHGLVRIPNINNFAQGMVNTFKASPLPTFLVSPIAYAIPFAEFSIGLLLILNKYTRETITATFVLMNTLIIGCCFAQKWDLVGLQTTYLGFLFLLLFFTQDKQSSK